MKQLFSLVLVFCALAVSAEDFDPGACPDLTVKIYPGNGNWRVLHATSSMYMHSAFGYEFAGVLTTGKTSKKRMRTYLRMDMGAGKSAQLDFLMTIPEASEHHYSLVTEYHWCKGVVKTVPLKTIGAEEGKLVFRSSVSIRHHITIDMKTNTAECAPGYLGRAMPVEWHKDGFKIRGLPDETGDFRFVMPTSNYRGCAGGVTAVRRKVGNMALLFPVYETFYLESGK